MYTWGRAIEGAFNEFAITSPISNFHICLWLLEWQFEFWTPNDQFLLGCLLLLAFCHLWQSRMTWSCTCGFFWGWLAVVLPIRTWGLSDESLKRLKLVGRWASSYTLGNKADPTLMYLFVLWEPCWITFLCFRISADFSPLKLCVPVVDVWTLFLMYLPFGSLPKSYPLFWISAEFVPSQANCFCRWWIDTGPNIFVLREGLPKSYHLFWMSAGLFPVKLIVLNLEHQSSMCSYEPVLAAEQYYFTLARISIRVPYWSLELNGVHAAWTRKSHWADNHNC